MSSTPLPVTVIGGYLGAGKTTLLNHILHEAEGIRFAVLVNDFGALNIDADLIEQREGNRINLSNGCICCSMAEGFLQAILSLPECSPLPEWVLVEASGVADPLRLAQYAHLPGFRLHGVITLVDAETIVKRGSDRLVGRQVRQQIEGADLVLLNKIDLISAERLLEVRAWLKQLRADLAIVEVQRARLPLAVLLADPADPPVQPHPTCADDDGHHHNHNHDYATWSFTGRTPLNGVAFRSFLSQLPEGVLRAKGFVILDEDPTRRFVLQLVGRRWELEPGEPWGEQEPLTRLTFIGLPGSLDPLAMEAALQALRAPPAAPSEPPLALSHSSPPNPRRTPRSSPPEGSTP